MKKFTTTLLLAIGLLVGFTVNAQAVNAATLNMSYSDYWYDRAKADGSEHHSWHFTLYDMDGEVAYCIQPNVKEGTHYNQGSWEDTGLSNSIKERILLIGYYGYTYPGHQTLQYRAATQGMIWDTIVGGGANTTFHTARWAKGDTFDVSNEKAQIEDLIAHHYDRPSFNGGVYKAQVGETITLTDTNNVLSNYSVSVSGADYSIDGNKLIIKPTRSGSIDLTLTKNMPYSSSYKLFVGDGIQNMMVPGTTDPVIAKIRVNSYTSFVEGHKKDSETGNAQGQATLKGAEYGVYETSTGRLVTTVVTDENGYFKSNAVLSWNDYYLQEIKPSEGYELDTTRYNVDIKGKESASVDVVEKVIKNYVSILKQYEQVDGNTTFLNAEKGITFEIYYPNGKKYGEIKTDKNGYASLNLPYGVWKFHQVNTTTGYEKIYDFYITVNETSEKEQYYNILNNTLYAYLQVIKVDSETGKTVIQSKYLLDIIRKMPNTDINIEVLEDLKVIISTENTMYNLNCLNIEDYPQINLEETKNPIIIESDVLKKIISQTIFAISTQESRPLLTGLNFKITGNVLECIATDSYRLAKKTIILDKEYDSCNIVIPGKNINEFDKLLTTNENVEIHTFSNKILFKYNGYLFQSSLLNGTYPNTSNLIPNEFSIILTTSLDKYFSAIDRAALLTQSKEKNIVKMETRNNELIVSSYASEIGKSEESVEVDKNTSEDISISFSSKYMLEALRTFEEEELLIFLNSDSKPIVLKSVKDESLIQLILPIKTY